MDKKSGGITVGISGAVAVGTAVSNSAYANYNGSVWNTNSSNSVYYKIESFG